MPVHQQGAVEVGGRVHVPAPCHLQDLKGAPQVDQDEPWRRVAPRKESMEKPRGSHLKQREHDLDGQRSGRDQGGKEKDQLRKRRVDRGDLGMIDQTVGVIPEGDQLLGIRGIPIRVDPVGLNAPIPDVPVDVVRKRRGNAPEGDPEKQAEHHDEGRVTSIVG